MLKAIILDDQQIDINNLTVLLQQHKERIKLLGSYINIEAGIKGIQIHKPDVLFLDIKLGDNQNGFDLLKRFEEPDFEIIFTTAHDQYAARAFRIAAIDYLLKPIDPSQLLNSIQRLEFKNSLVDKRLMRDSLLESLNSNNRPQSINIRTKDKINKLLFDDIIYCEAKINYTEFHLRNKPNLTVAQTIGNFEELLDPGHFYRIHKSHIVNFKHVFSYKRNSGLVTLVDTTDLKVADSHKAKFRNAWDDYKALYH